MSGTRPFSSPATGIIRWGIIGCGNVTEVKSGPGFQKADRSALVAVMRRTGEMAADYAKRHGVARWYNSAPALIADPDVDAVYIATPPGSHCEYALLAAKAGKPAYIEKPLARNTTEGQTIEDAFQEQNLPVYVAFYRRSLPRFLKVREILTSGVIGDLCSVHLIHSSPRAAEDSSRPWRLDPALSGGGLFLDLGSHALDLLDFLLGPLTHIEGSAATSSRGHEIGQCEDSVTMTFRTGGGAQGTATWDFAAAQSTDQVAINGTQGQITFSVFREAPVDLRIGNHIETHTVAHPRHIQQPLIQSIVDDLLGLGVCPSRIASALRTTKVMDTVLSDFYGGRSDRFWERPASWP